MSDDERPRGPAEAAFHFALGGALLPVLVVPVVWALAILSLRRAASDAIERRWSRRLVLLAIVDTLVAASVIVTLASGMGKELTQDATPLPRRIGVALEEAAAGPRVQHVQVGSPAEDAGLRAGDVIVRAGEREVRTVAEVQSEIAAHEEVALTIERGGRSVVVSVRPSASFVPDPALEPCRAASATPEWWSLAPYGVFVIVAGALWILGRRRGARQWTTWIPLVVILAGGSLLGALVTSSLCAYTGALRASAGGLLTTEIVMSIAGVAWLALVRDRLPEVADERPRWSSLRTYFAALLYAAAWMPRVMWLMLPLVLASRQAGAGEVSEELSSLLGARDPITFALVTTSAVLLAPIAEETLFRGVLMPHLARTHDAWRAAILTAILFGMLHVAHGVMLVGPLTLGCILGWARMRSRGLAVPIALHVTFNGTATLLGALG